MPRPLIGITTDFDGEKQFIRPAYADMVKRAGGLPVFLPLETELVPEFVARCDGFVLTGGDDPIMEQWDVATNPKATKVHAQRQEFELAMLDALRDRAPDKPVLGICLGMQYMALHAGGSMDQHLPQSNPVQAERHWGKRRHGVAMTVDGVRTTGSVLSHHRQAIVDPGSLQICAHSDDGLIEGLTGTHRAFYMGVQWHPERTEESSFGVDLFRRLIGLTSNPA